MYASKILVIQVVIFFEFSHTSGNHECKYPECLEEAERLKESIDANVDPCKNFVQFACGKKFKKFENQRNLTTHMKPTTYRLRLLWMRKRLQTLLDEPVNVKDDRGIGLAKTFWQSCKITTPDEAAAGIHFLFKRLGGWPAITDTWNISHFTWEKFSKCSRHLGFLPSSFIHVGINVDKVEHPWSPNDRLKILIDRPFLVKHSKLKNALYMVIANYLSDPKPPELLEIDKAIAFGRTLQETKCSGTEELMEMSIEELQIMHSFVNWTDYISSLLTNQQRNLFSNNYRVLVNSCFLNIAEELLHKTEKIVQANYAFLKIIDDLFRVIRPQLALTFSTKSSEIEQICFDATAVIFEKALDSLISASVNIEELGILEEMEKGILNITKHIIFDVSWIKREFQLQAEESLQHISFKNPSPVNKNTNDKYFDLLDLSQPDATLVLFRAVNVFLIDHYYLQAGHSRNKYILQNQTAIFQASHSPTEITVRSDPTSNIIYIPAGSILVGKFQSIPELNFVNYVLLGLEIAAVLVDHIYQTASYTEEIGSSLQDTSWLKSTVQQFMKQESCRMIGSVKTEDEILIFRYIWAIEIAYRAAFDSCHQKPYCKTKLPGLKYTPQQLFWIELVSADCDKNIGPRYNTMISQSERFAKDFKCPSGSIMNPAQKCKIL